LPSQKDGSFFVYQHLKEENSPLNVGSRAISKLPSKEYFRDIPAKTHADGSNVHLSFHPNRIYVKRRSKGGSTEHLFEEAEPQKFNKYGWRLNCILTPPPPSHMPILRESKDNHIVVFDWEHAVCPQVSILEFKPGVDWRSKISTLEKAEKYYFIETDGMHPTIALQLRKTNGEDGAWYPNCCFFYRVVKKN
jgi:hypothetical protein